MKERRPYLRLGRKKTSNEIMIEAEFARKVSETGLIASNGIVNGNYKNLDRGTAKDTEHIK